MDPFLPFFVTPDTGEECWVVEGRHVGGYVEISLSRETRHSHHHAADTFTPNELLAVKRFDHDDVEGYTSYANGLEDAARYAARGELGYSVHTAADGDQVVVCLVARLLGEDGRVRTDVSHEHHFSDPDSEAALVKANEQAAELGGLAGRLNDNWSSLREARLVEIQAAYEKTDADARSAQELQSIVEAEEEAP